MTKQRFANIISTIALIMLISSSIYTMFIIQKETGAISNFINKIIKN